jgi:hypothetical protein
MYRATLTDGNRFGLENKTIERPRDRDTYFQMFECIYACNPRQGRIRDDVKRRL